MNEKDNKTVKRIIGDSGEDAVIQMMTDKGFQLLCRNFEVHNVGELDCVFKRDDEIYVVEVRSRKNLGSYPSSAETVDHRKRQKILKTTDCLIRKYRLYEMNFVFLVAQVTHDASGMIKKIELIPF
ncbi:MAG: YraN family protein [Clostridiales bacterium]|nr:YraN family protein [Clostridiales bacterium]